MLALRMGQEVICTYSLGFFFGPGFPRGLGRPLSTPCPSPLLEPGTGPFRFFTGWSGFVWSADGTGVRFVSEGSSLADTGFSSTSTLGIDVDGGEGEDLTISFFGAEEKRDKSCGESLSMAIRDGFFILSDRA